MRKQFNPFYPVNCTYGSPMGRRGHNEWKLKGHKRLHCKHQGGYNGYDRGGAYWGVPYNVYAVWGHIDGDICYTYVRANSRQAAINKVCNGSD